MVNNKETKTQVRNSLVRNLDAFVKSVYGGAKYGIWLNNLKPVVKEVFISGRFDTPWYDAEEFYIEPTIALCRIFEKGHIDAAWHSGVWGVETWIRGRMKWVFEKLNTEIMLKSFLPYAVTHYYRPVQIREITVNKGEAVIYVEGMHSSESLLAYRFGGGVEKLLQLKGCNDVTVQIGNSTKKLVPCTVFIINWK